MRKEELDVIEELMRVIIIECDKGNINSIRDIAEFILKRIQGVLYE